MNRERPPNQKNIRCQLRAASRPNGQSQRLEHHRSLQRHEIGLITLVGLITKHGILIVEFANQLREQGMDTYKAVQQSASQRLRPILMTTGTMVLGAIPLALATGAGAESRQQIG
jgi:Cu/Ag efflux pump CusA